MYLLLLCCAPVGLTLLWLSPNFSRSSRLTLTGIVVILHVVFGAIGLTGLRRPLFF